MKNKSTSIDIEDYGATLAEEIKQISAAIRNTKLTDRALIVLLADASGVSKTDIKYVLPAIRRLEQEYLKQ